MTSNIRRVKVLYLAHPPGLREPYWGDVQAKNNGRHELRVYDENSPLEPQIEGVEVVVDQGGGHSTHEMADKGKDVKLWQILGTGFDHFDLPYWQAKKIPVANTPGQFSAVALGECAMMYILMLSRFWHESQANFQTRKFHLPIGLELEGRRLLMIGFGASAKSLATRALAFGMKMSAVDIREIGEAERKEFQLDEVEKPENMNRLIPNCDYLSLHLHYNPSTRFTIDAARFKLLKPSACLINVARGALVDEEAMYSALTSGRLAGAGLDVFGTEPVDPNSPLLKLPNVVATPHIAGQTDGTSRRRGACAIENVDRIAQGLPPLYRVDNL